MSKSTSSLPRMYTRSIDVGGIVLGGGNPIRVQSMLTCDTRKPNEALQQASELAEAGCEIVRVAIPRADALEGFKAICAQSPMPVVADIHFDYRLAIEASRLGASALRINPGNIGSWQRVDDVIYAARQAHIPIRIGVNAGSMPKNLSTRTDMSLAEKLVAAAVEYVDYFEQHDFYDIVLSAKAHDVVTTITTYRQLSSVLPKIPLHLGITEAGTRFKGTIKSSVGLGILLSEGIGDTLRVSLTADPVEEIPVSWEILSSLGLRRRSPELISCPTCARCQVNLIPIAEAVEQRLAELSLPISVAVMGCEVNGPGEAKDADIGVACGRGVGVIFHKGTIVARVPEADIVDALFKEITARYTQ